MYQVRNRFFECNRIGQTVFERPLLALRQWLDTIEVNNLQVARWLCVLIPVRCPFERYVQLFGRTVFYIPPLCKLNPLYEQLMDLRWRALTFLVDICKEDINQYS